MKGKKWILTRELHGEPNDESFKQIVFDLPDELDTGEVLLQAVYLSVDPNMKMIWAKAGDDVHGEQLSEVIKSRNDAYPVGSLVLSNAGWTSHYISKGDDLRPVIYDIGVSPKSYTLGVLGLPGVTAYLAIEKCLPRSSETVLISSAAGAIGNLIGQLAKLRGCKVIGLVASDEKLDWCKYDLGFDHVFNYKKVKFEEALHQVAPGGIDVYFDSIGGDFYTNILMKHTKKFGRIVIYDTEINFNEKMEKSYHATNLIILFNELTIMGYSPMNHLDDWGNAFVELNKLIHEGKLKAKETIYFGIDKMLEAFMTLQEGNSIGKTVVKAINERTNYP